LSRAVEAGVFESYRSPALDVIDPSLVDLVPDDLVTPVDFGDVCVNYDIDALAEAGVAPPVDFEDLADPAYRGLLAVQDPASSSPGLAFLIGTVVTFGDEWPAYWESLVANDVLVTDDWEEAYYGAFTRAGGDRPLVVSYGSSPPYEVLFDPERDSPPTGVAEGTCTRQVEFAGVLRGTERPEAARALVDFLVSTDFQRHVANDLYVFPVDPSVELDPVFTEFAVVPADSVVADPALVEASRSDWLERWADVVGR
jgi:thiamine transport system substrate-binding protein